MKTGIEQITEERTKQITKYNHTGFNDRCYTNKELLRAARAYLNTAIWGKEIGIEDWPWDKSYFKDEGFVECLKKAGAFIAAELDRIQLN